MTPPILGLIGGIGSGKSHVAAALARRGGVVVAGDPAGHEALRQPAIMAEVRRHWSEAVFRPDGEVDRRSLGKIVFADPEALKTLERIVFPWIGQRLREQMADAQRQPNTRFVVLDAAVMLEAGWNNTCDRIVYIDVAREVRLQRVRQRGWTDADLTAREASQWPLNRKKAHADFVIANDGEPAELERQIDDLLASIGLAKSEPTLADPLTNG